MCDCAFLSSDKKKTTYITSDGVVIHLVQGGITWVSTTKNRRKKFCYKNFLILVLIYANDHCKE